MHFKRIIDSSYPIVYETWKTEDATWVIQDLRPEDDEEAINILVEDLCTDETLGEIQKLIEDRPSVCQNRKDWREFLAQRMSLGCYEEKNGQKKLVGLNVCTAVRVDDDQYLEIIGEKWKNVYDAIKYSKNKVDPYEYMGLEIILQTMGLVVKREYRGAKLGKRLLAAREPLCKTQGIKGTATVFTGIASQKLAASCGFQTISETSISELAAAGLPYPRDDDRIIKYMVKKWIMHFKRIIDSSYPNVYETWKTEDATWVIQDLRPEDDDEAINILVEHLCTDETLCEIQKLVEDPTSVYHNREDWREFLAQRMSLGCYEEKNGQNKLVALNVCIAVRVDEDHDLEIKGEKWKNVYDAMKYSENKVDPYEYMGLEIILQTVGLVVKRDYRGAKLGKRLLAAREPLCKTQGIKGTASVFTGIASQMLAASCGFQTISEIPISELAAAGLPYPSDDNRIIKYMVKKYV